MHETIHYIYLVISRILLISLIKASDNDIAITSSFVYLFMNFTQLYIHYI